MVSGAVGGVIGLATLLGDGASAWLLKGFTGSVKGSEVPAFDCGVWGGEACSVRLRDAAAVAPRVAPAPAAERAPVAEGVRSGANWVTGRTLSCGGLVGVIGSNLGGGGGGATLLAANAFSFSGSISSIFWPCLFLRMKKKMKTAIKPTPRITPIAIPAFAPPVRPSDPDAPGRAVDEAADLSKDDVCVAAASSNPVLDKEEVEEVAVEKVVIAVGVSF